MVLMPVSFSKSERVWRPMKSVQLKMNRRLSSAAPARAPASTPIDSKNHKPAARNRLNLIQLVYHRHTAARRPFGCKRVFIKARAEIHRGESILRKFSRRSHPVLLLLAALSTVSLAAAAAVSPASQATSVPAASAASSAKPRARDLGVPFDGTPGPPHPIADGAGGTVGRATLIPGSGHPRVGEGPVRTGVTAVLPRG